MESGIYEIVHLGSGRRYVGSSKHVANRLYHHRYHLDRGDHCNRYLQRAWNKYGSVSFSLRLLESVPLYDLIECEQKHISDGAVFNLAPVAGSPLGIKRSAETIAKMHVIAKCRAANPQVRAAMSAMTKQLWATSEYRERLVSKQKQRCADPVERERLSAMAKKMWTDPLYRETTVAAMKVRRSDPAERQRMADRSRGKKPSTETRAKMAVSQKGRKHSDATKTKMRGPKSLSHRAAISAGRKGIEFTTEHRANLCLAWQARRERAAIAEASPKAK